MTLVSIEKIIQIKNDNKKQCFSIEGNNEITVKNVTIANIEDARWFNTDSQMDAFYDFLKHGYKGYFAYIDDVCVSRLWLFTNSQRTYLNNWFLYRLRNREFYTTWGLTAANYRGRGVFKALMIYLLNDNIGYSILGSVELDNNISLNAHKKYGYYVNRKILMIKIYKVHTTVQYNGGFKIKFGRYV